jgi:general secretion pathway protein C
MLARLSAFVVWALVAATAVFWGLRLWTRSAEAPQYTVPVGDAAVARGDLSRLLGVTPVAAAVAAVTPEAAARFRLIGIMAPKASAASAQPGQGVALIAVDGKPPKAFVVGSSLDTDLVLQSVSLRTAAIGPAQGAAAVTLELPPLVAAATGTLPPSGFGAPRNPAAAPAPIPPAPPQGSPAQPVPPSPLGQTRIPQAPSAAPAMAPPPPIMPMAPAGAGSVPREPVNQTLTQ